MHMVEMSCQDRKLFKGQLCVLVDLSMLVSHMCNGELLDILAEARPDEVGMINFTNV